MAETEESEMLDGGPQRVLLDGVLLVVVVGREREGCSNQRTEDAKKKRGRNTPAPDASSMTDSHAV